jgi:alkylated DNA repair protein alkB homolog 6
MPSDPVVQINGAPLPQWRQLSRRRLQTYPSPLSASNTLLAAPLPEWLSDPIVPRLLSIPLGPPARGGTDEESPPAHAFGATPHRAPNHVLVNEYPPGVGIFPHEDGAAYAPIVATVSLGSHVVLDIYAKAEGGLDSAADSGPGGGRTPAWRVLQEPRSLLITAGRLYADTLHGIAEIEVDGDLRGGEGGVANWEMLGDRAAFEGNGGSMERRTRISLTFRDVLKVRKVGGGLRHLMG